MAKSLSLLQLPLWRHLKLLPKIHLQARQHSSKECPRDPLLSLTLMPLVKNHLQTLQLPNPPQEPPHLIRPAPNKPPNHQLPPIRLQSLMLRALSLPHQQVLRQPPKSLNLVRPWWLTLLTKRRQEQLPLVRRSQSQWLIRRIQAVWLSQVTSRCQAPNPKLWWGRRPLWIKLALSQCQRAQLPGVKMAKMQQELRSLLLHLRQRSRRQRHLLISIRLRSKNWNLWKCSLARLKKKGTNGACTPTSWSSSCSAS